MSISRVGATNAAAASITGPNGNVGDIIVYHTFRSTAATIPTLASGCTSLGSSSGSTCAYQCAYEFCTTANASSRTFTGATQIVAVRYRNVRGFGAKNFAAIASSATMAYGAIASPIQSAGNSWFVGMGAHRTATNVNTAPTGMSTITSGSVGTGPMACVFDTNGGAASFAAANVTVNATSGRVANVLELLADTSTLNPYRLAASTALSNSNKTATFSGSLVEATTFATQPRTGEKRYVKWTVTTAETDTPTIGFGNDSSALNKSLGDSDDSNNSIGWNRSTGSIYLNGVAIGTPGTFTTGDIVWLAIDDGAKKVWCQKNSGGWNVDQAGTPSPDSGINGYSYSGINSGQLYPAVTLFDGGEVIIYDGKPSSPPSGLTTFKAWDVEVSSYVSATLDDLTSSLTDTVKVTPQATVTLADITISASATVTTSGPVSSASLAVTLDDVIISASDLDKVTPQASVTLDAVTIASTSQIKPTSLLSLTLDLLTSAASGIADAAGSITSTLADLTISSTATAKASGIISTTLDDITASLTDTAKASGNYLATLADATISAAAQTKIGAAFATAFNDLQSAGSDAIKLAGSAAVTLGDILINATVSTVTTSIATLDAVLGDIQIVSAAQTKIGLAVNATFDALVSAGTDIIYVAENVAATLQDATLAASVTTQTTYTAALNLALDALQSVGATAARASSVGNVLADCSLNAVSVVHVQGIVLQTLGDCILLATLVTQNAFTITPKYKFHPDARDNEIEIVDRTHRYTAPARNRSFTAGLRSFIFSPKKRGN